MLKAIKQFASRLTGSNKSNRRDAALIDMLTKRLKGTYDAARTTDEFRNYWANSDAYDADSANSKEVRHTLMRRSRYEVANNAYADGIAQTITNDLIGNGPSLRMQSGSERFNQMVELEWYRWSKAIGLRQKLWCMAHAKHVDGEAFAVMRRNRRVKHAIPMDIVLYEADQVQTPFVPFTDVHYIDGIKFDEFGQPLWYDLLHEHPGATNGMRLDYEPERVPADAMLHWFRLRRPGQHRGVPEMVSSMNAGAAARRWREANLSAAERAAILTLMMETPMSPDEADAIAPFTTMDIEKGLMSFLPMGWKPNQLEGKFPTANYEAFNKSLINEMGRSVNMPRNKAAADSSDYNYASGRLDHGTYYDSLDVQRMDCDASILTPVFTVWFALAIERFGWLGGDSSAVGPGAREHIWDWPKHRVADVEAEANANKTKLNSGQIGIHRLYSDAGLDIQDEMQAMADAFGVTIEEIKKRLLDVALPPIQQGGAPGIQPAVNDDAVSAALKQLERRRESIAQKPSGVANVN
jgi:capsid protein